MEKECKLIELDKIKEKGPSYLGFKDRDVLSELMMQKAKMFIMEQNMIFRGFYVLRYHTDEFTGERVLLIWLSYADPELQKQKIDIVSIISEYVDLKKAGRNYTK